MHQNLFHNFQKTFSAGSFKNKLQFAKTLSAMNSGQKLKQQDRVGANKNYLLFKQVQKFITEIPDEWLGKDKLKAVFDSLQYLNDYSSDN